MRGPAQTIELEVVMPETVQSKPISVTIMPATGVRATAQICPS